MNSSGRNTVQHFVSLYESFYVMIIMYFTLICFFTDNWDYMIFLKYILFYLCIVFKQFENEKNILILLVYFSQF